MKNTIRRLLTVVSTLFILFGIFNLRTSFAQVVTPDVNITISPEDAKLNQYGTLTVTATFDIPDSTYKAGDTTVIAFSNVFKVTQTADIILETKDGRQLGVAKVDPANKTITMSLLNKMGN